MIALIITPEPVQSAGFNGRIAIAPRDADEVLSIFIIGWGLPLDTEYPYANEF